MMRTLIEIYFAVNIFIAGIAMGVNWGYSHSFKEYGKCILSCILYLVAGTPYLIAVTLYAAFILLCEKTIIGQVFLFFCNFYLNPEYYKLKKEMVLHFNELTKERHQTKSANDRIWRFANNRMNNRFKHFYS